jgi:hypothetical protein|tara:strand:- start:373 stop:561 length:189 start_codon:yes stop_codon:yes gene_type:complete
VEKVYWTSRRIRFFSREVEAGWTYKLKNKESKIYETRLEAENALLLETLINSGKLDNKGYLK